MYVILACAAHGLTCCRYVLCDEERRRRVEIGVDLRGSGSIVGIAILSGAGCIRFKFVWSAQLIVCTPILRELVESVRALQRFLSKHNISY